MSIIDTHRGDISRVTIKYTQGQFSEPERNKLYRDYGKEHLKKIEEYKNKEVEKALMGFIKYFLDTHKWNSEEELELSDGSSYGYGGYFNTEVTPDTVKETLEEYLKQIKEESDEVGNN